MPRARWQVRFTGSGLTAGTDVATVPRGEAGGAARTHGHGLYYNPRPGPMAHGKPPCPGTQSSSESLAGASEASRPHLSHKETEACLGEQIQPARHA